MGLVLLCFPFPQSKSPLRKRRFLTRGNACPIRLVVSCHCDTRQRQRSLTWARHKPIVRDTPPLIIDDLLVSCVPFGQDTTRQVINNLRRAFPCLLSLLSLRSKIKQGKAVSSSYWPAFPFSLYPKGKVKRQERKTPRANKKKKPVSYNASFSLQKTRKRQHERDVSLNLSCQPRPC